MTFAALRWQQSQSDPDHQTATLPPGYRGIPLYELHTLIGIIVSHTFCLRLQVL